jgi:hypothetical protein
VCRLWAASSTLRIGDVADLAHLLQTTLEIFQRTYGPLGHISGQMYPNHVDTYLARGLT